MGLWIERFAEESIALGDDSGLDFFKAALVSVAPVDPSVDDVVVFLGHPVHQREGEVAEEAVAA